MNNTTRWTWPRVVAAGIAGLMALRVIFDVVMQLRNGFSPLGVIFSLAAGAIGLACLLYVFIGQAANGRRLLLFGGVGGGALGFLGFIGGFVGPIIFNLSANQGPLLGIFVTGPIGFVVGFLGGLLIGAVTAPVVRPPPLPPQHRT